MVVRPSLKRVVPGSVPPWRALCAESARALKAFFSALCVCRRFLSLFCCSNPSSGRSRQILHALNLRAFWVRAFCPRVGRGRCWAMFFVAAPWFSTPGNQKSAAAVHYRYARSLSTFAVAAETLLASRGAELPSWRGALQLSRPLARRNSQLLSALATYFLPPGLVRCSPIFATRHLLRRSRCVRFVDLRWCGSWPLVAGLGGWD